MDNTKPTRKHWSYAAMWLTVFHLPFLLTFACGLSPICCLIWLFLLLF
jgi:hypothetical protein